jgi:hypothetical protein
VYHLVVVDLQNGFSIGNCGQSDRNVTHRKGKLAHSRHAAGFHVAGQISGGRGRIHRRCLEIGQNRVVVRPSRRYDRSPVSL